MGEGGPPDCFVLGCPTKPPHWSMEPRARASSAYLVPVEERDCHPIPKCSPTSGATAATSTTHADLECRGGAPQPPVVGMASASSSPHIVAMQEVPFKTGEPHLAYTAKARPNYLPLAHNDKQRALYFPVHERVYKYCTPLAHHYGDGMWHHHMPLPYALECRASLSLRSSTSMARSQPRRGKP